MPPTTHLLASWIIGAKMTSNPRDCRLVALAGILPDVDGLGLIVDVVNQMCWHKRTSYYTQYHHYLLHGALGAVLIAVLLACFAHQRGRVLLLALLMVHLHLLCDFVGSRGPEAGDIWPILYFSPFNTDLVWSWSGQWRLDGWINRLLTVGLFFWALRLAVWRGYSVVGVFNRRADEIFVGTLRKWHAAWTERKSTIPI